MPILTSFHVKSSKIWLKIVKINVRFIVNFSFFTKIYLYLLLFILGSNRISEIFVEIFTVNVILRQFTSILQKYKGKFT